MSKSLVFLRSCPAAKGNVKLMLAVLALSLTQQAAMFSWPNSMPVQGTQNERHLKNIRQLTFRGQNAEAYWNIDGTKLIYQTRQPEWPDEQIITMNADGSDKKLVSTGKGRCTCSYFLPDMSGILFSSTHEKDPGPQAPADRSKGYVWVVNPKFSIYKADLDGANLKKVVDLNRYAAETTVAPNGKFMTFTSDYEGDLEIYCSDLDGTNMKRLTDHPGYDGGPFVSWDSKWIVYRRDTIDSPAALADYRELLGKDLVRPTKLEIFLMDSEGKHNRQVTHLGCASFAPFVQPDGKHIVFSSNYGDKQGREFEIFRIDMDGKNLEQITFSPGFDGFPMFTPDGKHIVWASNRNGKQPYETNIFVADWVD